MRQSVLFLLLVCTLVEGVLRNPDERLVFAFEVVRHGARAPIEDRDINKFGVGEGQLTPEGMRQRYLLGRYNRERYTEKFDLLSAEYDPREIYIQSTNVNRTMQSGYSELLGLYPPGQGPRITKQQSRALLTGGPASPPFNVRDKNAICDHLNLDALPGRPQPVAIMVYNNDDINDDVSADGCAMIGKTETQRADDQEIWSDYDWMIQGSREPIEEMFNLTDEYVDNLNFHDYEHMTDTAVALDYEGYPEHETYFSDNQWELTHEFQKVWLQGRESVNSDKLEISRMLRKPLSEMLSKVNDLMSGSEPASDLKFMLYSAHDDQITNMLTFLAADFAWVPYASTVTFELKYSVKCLESRTATDACFGVSVRSNGMPLRFPGCTGDNFVLEGCKWAEFKALMNEKWYDGPGAPDLDAACTIDQ